MKKEVIENKKIKVIRYEFTEQDILKALHMAGMLPQATFDYETYVRVPGGGDWSNTNLNLDDHPLIVDTIETIHVT